jgi:hypothetical protein
MGFASTWIESRTLFPQLIKEAPDNDTGIIVIVPAYNESGINSLLDSLISCKRPGCRTEVLIIINAPAGVDKISLANNIEAYNNIDNWKKVNKDHFYRLYPIDLGQPDFAEWGVGLARKAGMDEALRRFNIIDRPDGIIVNLDADCHVQDNYFQALENDFLLKKDRKACSISFEHPLTGAEFPEEIYRAVAEYELHLRYYYQALKYSGFPYVFHTVGSTIAVRALTYLKAGGMNRRRAGEDFYFIQKLVPAGGYFSLNTTTVFPSPRVSARVPFGTGMTMSRMTDRDEKQFMTYNPLAFKDLRDFFRLVESSFESNDKQLHELFSVFPAALSTFLEEEEWLAKIKEINKNTSGLQSFTKRFFYWFNMFKVVKYLNYVHNLIYKKTEVNIAASDLLRYTGHIKVPSGTIELLKIYRDLEKIN